MAEFKIDPGELRVLLSSNTGPVWRRIQILGEEVKNRAQRNMTPGGETAAFKTGRLRSSITSEMIDRGGLPVARVGTNVRYAVPVHEGWRTRRGKVVAGRPYLRRALEQIVGGTAMR